MKSTGFVFTVLISIVAILVLAACGSSVPTPDPKAPKPSNSGGTGQALTLTGNAQNGEKIFAERCAVCHGDQGKGGVPNPGSEDGTVPPLSPIDDTLENKDPKVFAANIDLFIEHGSKPEGTDPQKSMLPFGDSKTLSPQEIADVIAYVISLNPQ